MHQSISTRNDDVPRTVASPETSRPCTATVGLASSCYAGDSARRTITEMRPKMPIIAVQKLRLRRLVT